MDIVEKANNFFMSVWHEAIIENKNIEVTLKKKRNQLHKGKIIKTSLNLIVRYIPADTRVAECINAEAGIGASIESGNQKKNKN